MCAPHTLPHESVLVKHFGDVTHGLGVKQGCGARDQVLPKCCACCNDVRECPPAMERQPGLEQHTPLERGMAWGWFLWSYLACMAFRSWLYGSASWCLISECSATNTYRWPQVQVQVQVKSATHPGHPSTPSARPSLLPELLQLRPGFHLLSAR